MIPNRNTPESYELFMGQKNRFVEALRRIDEDFKTTISL